VTRSVADAARAVLDAGEPLAKIKAARAAARDWRLGRLEHRFDVAMPMRPARPEHPELLPPNRMPKRRKGGSERGRIALIHALAHIEFAAIDLAFDVVGRFGGAFPRGFTDEWMQVGADEAMHFALLDRRRRPRTIRWPGSQWFRWCSRRVASTLRRRRSSGSKQSGTALQRRSSPAS
jgi:uncharacterized ferritin-like protein (DUF455 family)